MLGNGRGATQTGRQVLGKETRCRVSYWTSCGRIPIKYMCAPGTPGTHTHDCCSGLTPQPVPHCNLNLDITGHHSGRGRGRDKTYADKVHDCNRPKVARYFR